MPMTRSISLPICGSASAYLHPTNILTHACTTVPQKHRHAQQQFGCSSKWPWPFSVRHMYLSLTYCPSHLNSTSTCQSIDSVPLPGGKISQETVIKHPLSASIHGECLVWSGWPLNWVWCVHAHVSKSATSCGGNYNMWRHRAHPQRWQDAQLGS